MRGGGKSQAPKIEHEQLRKNLAEMHEQKVSMVQLMVEITEVSRARDQEICGLKKGFKLLNDMVRNPAPDP